jgi:hypothetical protein
MWERRIWRDLVRIHGLQHLLLLPLSCLSFRSPRFQAFLLVNVASLIPLLVDVEREDCDLHMAVLFSLHAQLLIVSPLRCTQAEGAARAISILVAATLPCPVRRLFHGQARVHFKSPLFTCHPSSLCPMPPSAHSAWQACCRAG